MRFERSAAVSVWLRLVFAFGLVMTAWNGLVAIFFSSNWYPAVLLTVPWAVLSLLCYGLSRLLAQYHGLYLDRAKSISLTNRAIAGWSEAIAQNKELVARMEQVRQIQRDLESQAERATTLAEGLAGILEAEPGFKSATAILNRAVDAMDNMMNNIESQQTSLDTLREQHDEAQRRAIKRRPGAKKLITAQQARDAYFELLGELQLRGSNRRPSQADVAGHLNVSDDTVSRRVTSGELEWPPRR